MCAKGTSDDEMWSLVKQKLNVLSGAGLTKENFSQADAIDNFQEKTKKPNLFQELLDEEAETVAPESEMIALKPETIAHKTEIKIPGQLVSKKKTSIDDDDDDEMLINFDFSKFDVPVSKKLKH